MHYPVLSERGCRAPLDALKRPGDCRFTYLLNPFKAKRADRIQTLLFLMSVYLAVTAWPGSAAAQTRLNTFSLQGRAEAYAEVYDIHGAPGRRPPNTQRLFVTPTLQITPVFSISANLLLSTEGSELRQDMNLAGLHPRWRWGQAHVGDYTPVYAPMVLNGVNIRGGGLSLFPGRLRLDVAAGQSRRSVDGLVVEQSYSQKLYGARLGYGSEHQFFDVVFMKAKDDVASLKKADSLYYQTVIADTMEVEQDTIWTEPPYHPLNVTPEENLVVGINARHQFWDRRLDWTFSLQGSAYTQDLYAPAVPVDSLDVPEVLSSLVDVLFEPRRSSVADYALKSSLSYKVKSGQVKVSHGYIGPGYKSLGLPSTVNDRRQWQLDGHLKVAGSRLSLNWQRLSNNLLGQKLATDVRNQIRLGLVMRRARWQGAFNVNYLDMGHDARPGMGDDWTYDNFHFSTQQSWLPADWKAVRQLGLRYQYQSAVKESGGISSRSRYHTVNLTGQIKLPRQLALNMNAGLSFRNTPQGGDYSTQVYSLRLTHSLFKGKIQSSLLASSSMVRDTRVQRLGANAVYRLTRQDRLRFNLFYHAYQGGNDFHEVKATLALSHRF